MTKWKGAVASREEVREQKRNLALRIAAEMFNARGYHATSLDDVADRIGVTKAALYYYFKNKDELLYSCMKLTYGCGEQARAEAKALDGNSFAKLQHLYTRFMELLMQDHHVYTTEANIYALPEAYQEALRERRRVMDRESRDLIKAAIAEGTIRPVDVRLTSNYLLGAVNWILRWHTENEEYTAEEIANHFFKLFLNGVKPT